MTQRLSHGGAIDRTKPLRFTFDGKPYEGFAGDTVASALLADGVRIVGRSFKYHRPRGIYTAGPEEPNAILDPLQGRARVGVVTRAVAQVEDGGRLLRPPRAGAARARILETPADRGAARDAG